MGVCGVSPRSGHADADEDVWPGTLASTAPTVSRLVFLTIVRILS